MVRIGYGKDLGSLTRVIEDLVLSRISSVGVIDFIEFGSPYAELVRQYFLAEHNRL
jgi:hypothetical protein